MWPGTDETYGRDDNVDGAKHFARFFFFGLYNDVILELTSGLQIMFFFLIQSRRSPNSYVPSFRDVKTGAYDGIRRQPNQIKPSTVWRRLLDEGLKR